LKIKLIKTADVPKETY